MQEKRKTDNIQHLKVTVVSKIQMNRVHIPVEFEVITFAVGLKTTCAGGDAKGGNILSLSYML